MGRQRPELADGIRSFVSGSFVVFYTVGDAGVIVIRVLHHARDLGPEDFA
jgi:toxin ParE1/3/4